MSIKYISDKNLKNLEGKTCLLRIDLNAKKNEEKEYYRLQVIIPTIQKLLNYNIKVVLISHQGRYGKNPSSLEPFAEIISKKINTEVKFIKHFSGAGEEINKNNSKIFLLENLRFYKEEQENSKDFAKKLADLADFYVNDAFPVCHRKNASVVEITRFLPSFGGLHLQKELEILERVIKNPEHPLTLILGGIKTSDKLGVLKNLWDKIDNLLLGGGPANTFLEEQGIDTGNSVKNDSVKNEIQNYATSDKIFVPVDYKIEENQISDIGEKTAQIYADVIQNSKTIIWNGPMGKFEEKKFSEGTKSIWQAILKNKDACIIVGGGETVSSIKLLPDHHPLSANLFLSTGGGAMLAYLAGEEMPGLKALNKN